MRLTASALLWAAVAAQSYPPPFPRPNAVKMFDNARVQVWDVVWPKGQATPLHRHLYDITGTYYQSGDRVITEVDGSKRQVSTKAGGIVWQFKGLTHIEAGTSDQPLRAVMIELKGNGSAGQPDTSRGVAPFSGNGTMPLLDNERVMVWEYTRPQSTPPQLHRHMGDSVIVWLDGGTPHVAFLNRGTSHAEESMGAATRATIFELK